MKKMSKVTTTSRLQHIIDHQWQDSKLYLILCGSSMSFMEYQFPFATGKCIFIYIPGG